MRLNSLDHLRGFGIILVIVFSLWQFMYFQVPEFGLLVHNQQGEFNFGDLVFPLFLFCTGVSVWFYYNRHRARGGKIEQAEKKFLSLLIVALVISSFHLFGTFPDEVTLIALCDILLFNLLWHRVSRRFLLAYSIAFPLLLFAFQKFLPQFWAPFSGMYLRGIFAIPYYLIIAIFGSIMAQDAFPNAAFDRKKSFSALEKWIIILLSASLASSLLFPIDKMGFSPSFLPAALLFSAALFWLFLHLFEVRRLQIDFLRLIGKRSLWGWALLFFFSGAIFVLGTRGSYDPAIYLPLCALLLILLYAALWAREKIVTSSFWKAFSRLSPSSWGPGQ